MRVKLWDATKISSFFVKFSFLLILVHVKDGFTNAVLTSSTVSACTQPCISCAQIIDDANVARFQVRLLQVCRNSTDEVSSFNQFCPNLKMSPSPWAPGSSCLLISWMPIHVLYWSGSKRINAEETWCNLCVRERDKGCSRERTGFSHSLFICTSV